jgi:hypothetical protein
LNSFTRRRLPMLPAGVKEEVKSALSFLSPKSALRHQRHRSEQLSRADIKSLHQDLKALRSGSPLRRAESPLRNASAPIAPEEAPSKHMIRSFSSVACKETVEKLSAKERQRQEVIRFCSCVVFSRTGQLLHAEYIA